MNAKVFTIKFIELFPEYKGEYVEHIDFNDVLLPHVFFGDSVIENMIQKMNSEESSDQIECKRFFDYLEQMLEEGNKDLQELITVTILAKIGDEKKVLRKASSFFGPNLEKSSKEIEEFWE